MINLYPWNLYLLLAAAIAVLVSLILMLKPLMALKKAADQLSSGLEPAAAKAEALQKKSEQVSQIGSNLLSNLKTVLTAYIILRAFRRKDDSDSAGDTLSKGSRKVTASIRKGLSSDDLKLLKTIRKL